MLCGPMHMDKRFFYHGLCHRNHGGEQVATVGRTIGETIIIIGNSPSKALHARKAARTVGSGTNFVTRLATLRFVGMMLETVEQK